MHDKKRKKTQMKKSKVRLYGETKMSMSTLFRSRDHTTLFNFFYFISVMRSSFDYWVKSSLDLVLSSPSPSPRPVSQCDRHLRYSFYSNIICKFTREKYIYIIIYIIINIYIIIYI